MKRCHGERRRSGVSPRPFRERRHVVPEWLDLMAVVVGALAGVLVAAERDLDLVGFIGMCLICALGGGLIRDVIMQVGDVYVLNSVWPILVSVITALLGFTFPHAVRHFPNLYEWVDMFSVALFVVAGASKAVAYGLHAPAVLLMGTLTGVGGGMLRDVVLGEIPQVFRRSNLYALCAVAGSFCFLWCSRTLRLEDTVSVVATVATVVLLRRISLRYDIKSPTGIGLEDKVIDVRNQLRKRKDKRNRP